MRGLSPITRSSAAGYSLLLLISFGLIAWQGRLDDVLRFPGWPRMGWNIVVGAVLAALVLGAGAAMRGRFEWARRLEEEFQSLLAPLHARDAVVLAVASGVAEEAFFRVFLQPSAGLVVASLAFGLLHYPPNRRMIPWTIIAVVMGFAFGLVYEWTGSLVSVAVAHALINFFELLDIARSGGGPHGEVAAGNIPFKQL